MKIFYQIFSVAILVALLVGCCNCRAVRKNQLPIVGTEWQLVQLGEESMQPQEDRFTIQFIAEENRFAGVGDGNRLTATYVLDEKQHTVRLENAGMTRMMTPNQALEDRFVEMLGKVTAYDMDGTMLMLFADKELLAVFQAK